VERDVVVKPWDRMRREIAGLMRSVRYDMDRRTDGADGGPGSSDTWFTRPVPPREKGTLATAREPRRLIAAGGVASIIVASAAGTYFAVAGGLGMLIADAAGVPVVPQAVPMMPLIPIPHLGDKKTTHRALHRTVKPAAPTASDSPTPAPAAPVRAAGPRPAPAPEAGRTTPAGTPTGHIPVPESTETVTPSKSPSAGPSPSAASPSGSGQPQG